jgi:hypothetical protein
MANPIATNGTHYRRERYADAIVQLMRQEFNIRNDFKRDYERDPVSGGINIPVRGGDITLSNYDILNGITLTQSATTYTQILLDNHKGFSELVDGYEALAIPDNIRAQRLESASYILGKTLEESAINALVDGGTTEVSTSALTTDTVYSTIATSVKTLKARGIKATDLRIAVSADTELLLLTDSKFANTSGQLGAELIRDGMIGRINGVTVKANYLMPANVEYIVYAIPWCQSIDEWKVLPNFVDINDGKHIGASALQGRMIYKDTVTNALAVQVKTNGALSV